MQEKRDEEALFAAAKQQAAEAQAQAEAAQAKAEAARAKADAATRAKAEAAEAANAQAAQAAQAKSTRTMLLVLALCVLVAVVAAALSSVWAAAAIEKVRAPPVPRLPFFLPARSRWGCHTRPRPSTSSARRAATALPPSIALRQLPRRPHAPSRSPYTVLFPILYACTQPVAAVALKPHQHVAKLLGLLKPA